MANRGDVGLVFGIGGLLLGGAGAYLGFRADARTASFDATSAHDGEMIETLATKVDGLRKDVKEAYVRISAVVDELEQRKKDDETLRARLAAVEEKLPK